MTVQFNVGGKHFQISRAVVNNHPDSELSRLMADPSQTEPIFIDRNGDVFALVLDYMRHGQVVLPITCPMDTFQRDLEHYGIPYKEGTVRRDSYHAAGEMTATMAHHQEQLDCLRARTKSLDLTNKMEALASFCFRRYVQDYKKGLSILPIFILLDEGDECFAAAQMLNDPQMLEVLQNCLLKYRLKLQAPKAEDSQDDRLLLRVWTL